MEGRPWRMFQSASAQRAVRGARVIMGVMMGLEVDEGEPLDFDAAGTSIFAAFSGAMSGRRSRRPLMAPEMG